MQILIRLRRISLMFISAIVCAPQLVSAHVAYVVPEEKIHSVMGHDWRVLFDAVSDPINLAMIAVTGLVVLVLAFALPRIGLFNRVTKHVVTRLESYHEFIPWIIRIALGIALLGAGTTNVLISPTLQNMPQFAVIQITLGFLFLLGFMLVPVTIATIMLYIIALKANTYLIGNIETPALAIGFLVFHSYRPGLDDIFDFQLFKHVHFSRHWLAPILRLGIGVAMIFLALYEKILNPHMSLEVVSMYHLTSVIPVSAYMWVVAVGIIECVVGLLLLIGFYTRTTAFVAFIVLSTTFFFFKESVTAHITLFALLSILLIEGGGKWSVDTWLNYVKNRFRSGQNSVQDSSHTQQRPIVVVIARDRNGKLLIVKRAEDPYKGAWSLIGGTGGLYDQRLDGQPNHQHIVVAARSEISWDLGIDTRDLSVEQITHRNNIYLCEVLLKQKDVTLRGRVHAADIMWINQVDAQKYLTVFNDIELIRLYQKLTRD